jgi:hypothetical protein
MSNIPISSKLVVWNALRISIASIYTNIILTPSDPAISHTVQAAVFIILSYVITFDVGNTDNPLVEGGLGSESGNYKGINTTSSDILEASTSSEDIVLRASNGMLTDMPLKNVHDEIKMKQRYNIESLEVGDIIL